LAALAEVYTHTYIRTYTHTYTHTYIGIRWQGDISSAGGGVYAYIHTHTYTHTQVYGGKETSAALAEVGRVYTWGQGDQFQLGHDSKDNKSTPHEIDALGKVWFNSCFVYAHL
jgi:hypothetical protein